MAKWWYSPTSIEWVHRAQRLNMSMEEMQETGKFPTEEECKEIYENIRYLEKHLKFVHTEMMKLPPYKKVVEEIEREQETGRDYTNK